ncbi:hypothetical protein B0H17DRAFT_1141687 [Mycena rosella]|uniref:Uncharacterized protein n=1 Tax=Mycena rosella TaxID=1033263 RepID=A0AAD7CZD3_MYCRO|nr:hypothetical protein B0H17DRAFT_1141687 [Mycena rosella]
MLKTHALAPEPDMPVFTYWYSETDHPPTPFPMPPTHNAHFAQEMAEMHWDLRQGTRIMTPEPRWVWSQWQEDTESPLSPTSSYRHLKAHGRYAAPLLPGVASSNAEKHSAIPYKDCAAPAPRLILMGLNVHGQTVWNTHMSQPQSHMYRPCPECLFFECPNATGKCACPYATVYEIPDRYGTKDLAIRTILEEMSECGMGLDRLAPMAIEDPSESAVTA